MDYWKDLVIDFLFLNLKKVKKATSIIHKKFFNKKNFE